MVGLSCGKSQKSRPYRSGVAEFNIVNYVPVFLSLSIKEGI
jgi:hypothetical protein